jgi:hypothetical protein
MLKGMLVASTSIAHLTVRRFARRSLVITLPVLVALNILPSNTLASDPVTQTANTLACPIQPPPACEVARIAVLDAQSAVQAALDRRALWTTAQDALKQARAAFLTRDYPARPGLPEPAIEQAHLGIAQSQRHPASQNAVALKDDVAIRYFPSRCVFWSFPPRPRCTNGPTKTGKVHYSISRRRPAREENGDHPDTQTAAAPRHAGYR